jgi:hypothetical protein
MAKAGLTHGRMGGQLAGEHARMQIGPVLAQSAQGLLPCAVLRCEGTGNTGTLSVLIGSYWSLRHLVQQVQSPHIRPHHATQAAQVAGVSQSSMLPPRVWA